MRKLENRKPNKSSIVKIVISDFDKFGIKELKVIYRKNKGVDVWKLDSSSHLKDGKTLGQKLKVLGVYDSLDDQIYKADEINKNGKVDLEIKSLDNTSIILEKKVENKVVKKYVVSLDYTRTNMGDISVRAKIVDRLFYGLGQRRIREKSYEGIRIIKLNYELYSSFLEEKEKVKKRRRLGRPFSSTQRILLDEEATDYYERISGIEDVSSRQITWINKFVDYRSSMLLYHRLINNLLVKDLRLASNEFEKNAKDYDNYLGFKENINWNRDYGIFMDKVFRDQGLSIEINSFIEKHNKNIEDKMATLDIKDPQYEEEKLRLSSKYISLQEVNTREDFRKIYKIISFLKRELLAYNYQVFRKIYSGERFLIGEEDLKELLDLDVFRILSKVSLVKPNIKTNYLSEKTRVFILGENVKAKKILSRYINISERVDGFNDFINYNIDKYLGQDGLVAKEYNEYFFNSIEILENSPRPNKFLLRDYKNLKEWIGAPFIEDIHLSKEYKKLYNIRKNLMERIDKNIESNDILKLNRKMKNISNLNSKYRLQIKMQFAFGYIKRFWDEDLDKISPSDNIQSLVEKMNSHGNWKQIDLGKEEFLSILKAKDKGNTRMIGKLIEHYEFKNSEDIFAVSDANNLLKIYILIYSLLPVELRGEFLRFIKKNMYDISYIDDLSRSKSKERFFRNLSLFERNTSKLELINYSVTDIFIENSSLDRLNEFIEKYLISSLDGPEETRLVERIKGREPGYIKSFIVPVFEYYKIIYKLLNDIEIQLLYNRARKDDTSLRDIVAKEAKALELREIVQDIDLVKLSELDYIRRNLMAMKDEKLLFEILSLRDKLSISGRLEGKISEISVNDIIKESMNKNVINDYYMRKEQLVLEARNGIKERKLLKVKSADKKLKPSLSVKGILDRIDFKEKELRKMERLNKIKYIKKLEKDLEGLFIDLDKKMEKLGIALALDIISKDEIRTLKVERIYDNEDSNKDTEMYYFRYNKLNSSYEDIYGKSGYTSKGNFIIIDEKRDDKFPVQRVDLSKRYRQKLSFRI